MIDFTRRLLVRLQTDERGLSAVEYAVLGAVVVGAILALREGFQTNLRDAFTSLFNGV